MEKFSLDGKKYFVKWSYNRESGKQSVTFCDIFDENDTLVTFANATVSKNDNFDKRVGRKLSFQRALFGAFNKEQREIIWKYKVLEFSTKLFSPR